MKKILKIFSIFVVCLSLSLSSYSVWVPDAWDVYPEEFYKIFEISSKYTTKGMNLKRLTVSNFKNYSYKPDPVVEGLQLDILASKFKQDSENEDVVGWVYVPNTNVNYPIVQHPTDTNFYAKRNYEKIENNKKDYGFPGVIWIDSNCKFKNIDDLSENTVLYGHNWENYTANPKKDDFRDIMFSQLNSFHHFDYAKERPYIYISSLEKTIPLKIFSVFYTEDEFCYHVPNPNEKEKLNIVEEALTRSRFVYDSPVYSTDKIFTFSTCTRAYGKGRSDQKFVIMARPLRDGESVNDELSDTYITVHKNHKEPTLKKISSKK